MNGSGPVDPVAARFRHSVLAAQRNGSRVLAEHLKDVGLTPAWAEAVSLLHRYGPMTIRELGDLLLCEADHPSRLVSRLDREGLVTRSRSATDARATLVLLTSTGQRAARAVADLEQRMDEVILDRVSATDLDAVSELLGRLVDPVQRTALQRRYGSAG